MPATDTRAVLFVGGVLLKISSIKKLRGSFLLQLTLSIMMNTETSTTAREPEDRPSSVSRTQESGVRRGQLYRGPERGKYNESDRNRDRQPGRDSDTDRDRDRGSDKDRDYTITQRPSKPFNHVTVMS